MKMKKLLALLLCVCILGGLVACGGDTDAVDGSGAGENAGTEADNTEVDLPVSGKTAAEIAKEYDTVSMASYVDTNFLYSLDYPASVGYIDTTSGEVEYDAYYADVTTTHCRSKITTILGRGCFSIYYPTLNAADLDEEYAYTGQYDTAEEFYNNYFKDAYYKPIILVGNSEGEITEEKHTNTYTFGELTWEEYSYTITDYPNIKLYITVKDKIPMLFIFELLDESNFESVYAPTKALWNDIKDNRDSIILSIISSVKFSDSKEALMNIKELSVCTYGSYDATHITTQENLLYTSINLPDIRNSSIDGFSFANDGTVTIDNALDTICSLPVPESGLFMNIGSAAMLGSDASVSVDKTGDTYTLHSGTVGDYQIKYYEVTVTSTSGSTSKELLYTFVTESTYGFILNGAYHETAQHDLDYAVKHMIFIKDDEYRFWELEDYIRE